MMRRLKNNFFRQEGFSLIEIIIAITIASMLIGFAFGIYLFGQRYIVNWQQDLELQNELHTLANGMSEAIYAADRIRDIESAKLTLEMKDESLKTYEMKNDTLLYNEKNILRHPISPVAFSITSVVSEGEETKKQRSDNIGQIKSLKLSLALTNGEDTMATKRTVHLRKPSNWSTQQQNH